MNRILGSSEKYTKTRLSYYLQELMAANTNGVRFSSLIYKIKKLQTTVSPPWPTKFEDTFLGILYLILRIVLLIILKTKKNIK